MVRRAIHPRSTSLEADAVTTWPLRRSEGDPVSKQPVLQHLQSSLVLPQYLSDIHPSCHHGYLIHPSCHHGYRLHPPILSSWLPPTSTHPVIMVISYIHPSCHGYLLHPPILSSWLPPTSTHPVIIFYLISGHIRTFLVTVGTLRFWFMWTSFKNDLQKRCTSFWNQYQRKTLFAVDFSITWATNRNWLSKLLDRRKVTDRCWQTKLLDRRKVTNRQTKLLDRRKVTNRQTKLLDRRKVTNRQTKLLDRRKVTKQTLLQTKLLDRRKVTNRQTKLLDNEGGEGNWQMMSRTRQPWQKEDVTDRYWQTKLLDRRKVTNRQLADQATW